MAGAGKSLGPKEAGFLDVATYTLAGILLFFLVVSLTFERSTQWLMRYLKKRKRNGLAQAVSNLVLELTLVGLVSLLLIVLQDPIANICVPYSSSTIQQWSLIGNVPGCDCCLEDTDTVGSCFLASRQCGDDFCNCGGKNASCLAEEPSLQDLLQEWSNSSGCTPTECSLEYLQRAAETPQAEAARDALKLECDGERGRPASAEGTPCAAGCCAPLCCLEVHIFIFTAAMTHVFMGILMILLSTWRLRSWRRLCGDEDEHARGVRKLLDRSTTPEVQPAPTGWQRLMNSRLLRRHTMPTSRSRGAASSPPAGAGSPATTPASPTAAAAAAAENGAAAPAAAFKEDQPAPPPARGHSMPALVAAAVAASKQAEGGAASDKLDPSEHSRGSDQLAVAEAAAERGQQTAQQQQPPSDSTGGEPGQNGSSRVAILAPVASKEMDGSTSIKRGDYAGWAQEYAICLLHMLLPRPVSAEQLRLMRASFMLSHRVPEGFDFWLYINLSMEDDFSQIVGVSLEMHVCRGAKVNQLSSQVFWFNKPALLLHPIKYLLFLCSFMFASAVSNQRA
ncbi:hypothetical protein CHLNCDRAFT_55622 [Chlorella variabilis]|uniref:MLO-like protein n=1 Tax=Chlorella variabilis TaxID=554065 RepID=E1ZTY9_CHLVA|nr:hypothetical protein CHLNCDRAFT_55622 [Chlorella variabilis]EFN50723.1 hypothetical protein CHLNCDRAFT_55622 [Chlorella variabilis]|eukprot:XP_005842835.1 hypothetical protein CHLNCDRAFT_55622 [Chlorella variabilis]